MVKDIIRTADDEEPICIRCENLDCDEDELCEKRCGPQHGWAGYCREVEEEQNDIS